MEPETHAEARERMLREAVLMARYPFCHMVPKDGGRPRRVWNDYSEEKVAAVMAPDIRKWFALLCAQNGWRYVRHGP